MTDMDYLEGSNLLKDLTKVSKFKHYNAHGRGFIEAVLPELTKDIEEMQAKTRAMYTRKLPSYITCVEDLEPGQIGLIMLLVCLDMLWDAEEIPSQVTLAARMSRVLQQELNYHTLEKANAALLSGIEKTAFTRNRGLRSIEEASRNGDFGPVDLVEWTKPEALNIGMMYLKLLENIGFLVVTKAKSKTGKTLQKWMWSEHTLEWSQATHERWLYLTPNYLPLVSPPEPWVDGENRSYGAHFPPIRFRENCRSSRNQGLSNGYHIDAANALGNVAYQINDDVFGVVQELWGSNVAVGGLINSQPLDPYAIPYPRGGSEDDIAAWNHQAHMIHVKNGREHGRRLYMSRTLSVIKGYAGTPFHFVWRCDSRGRYYPVASTLLNPQGSDLGKGLLKFHETHAKPLGSQGIFWLKMAITEHYGNDKVSMESRDYWVDDNMDIIRAVASSPIDSLDLWRDTDSPFQFLGACMELVAALDSEDPEEYMSSYPISFDGRCSGAQHWAALLRDEVTAKSVGLTPSNEQDTPPDLYSEILHAVMRALVDGKDYDNPEYREWWAALASEGVLDRKLAKKPVMTKFYNATDRANTAHFKQWLKDNDIECGVIEVDGEERNDRFYRAAWLSKVFKGVMGTQLASAVQGMEWIVKCARTITKAGNDSIDWVTPHGFEVSQQYRKTKSARVDIRCRVFDVRFSPSMNVMTDNVDSAQQARSLPPNFIHSRDASHITSVALRCHQDDVPFWPVHDSFATVPGLADELRHVVKSEFVSMHEPEVLKGLKEYWETKYDIELPKLPEPGELNIMDVMDSVYAFS